MRLTGKQASRALAAGLPCLLALVCGACASASSGTAGQPIEPSGQLKVVTFTPAPGQPVPSDLVTTSALSLGEAGHGGYACFTMNGTPVDWPPGFSALPAGAGQPRVRTGSGTLLRQGAAYQFTIMTIQSSGDACSVHGENVTAILAVQS